MRSPSSDHSALGPPPALSSASQSVLLDFDGTLVDLVDRPDAVVVDRGLAELIRQLVPTFDGRIALVSGRSIAQLLGMWGSDLDGVAVVGSHGAEMRVGAQRAQPDRPHALVLAERSIRAAFAERDGVVIEVKTLGIAVHYRLDPDAESAARGLVERLASENGLAVQDGKMMIELRTAGHDKGSGIASLMQQPPFAGTVPVFVGDDVTDEAGFASVRDLGGSGVLVGPARITAARYRLENVAAVRAWLEQAS